MNFYGSEVSVDQSVSVNSNSKLIIGGLNDFYGSVTGSNFHGEILLPNLGADYASYLNDMLSLSNASSSHTLRLALGGNGSSSAFDVYKTGTDNVILAHGAVPSGGGSLLLSHI